MLKIENFIENRLVQNLFIWLGLFIVLLATITSENRVVTTFYTLLILVPPIYVNNLFILPLFRKNTVKFVCFFILNLLLFSALSVFAIYYFGGRKISGISYINFFGILFLAVSFASTIKLVRDNFMRRQQEKEAELKLLKAQLNPHFLFNTLNNLYGLSVIKSDKLPNLMLKLSDLLRYSLYETKEQLVPLSKEIAYLQNYISLEKIRLENTEINFTVNGKIDEKEIAPMLFIVFVENAFKHLSTEKSKVDIEITTEENNIYFSCKNTIDRTKLLEENLEKGKSGIGLANAKKRLALIYSEKHELKINNINNIFSVDLIIEV